jgi:hypothetical protein
MGKEKLYYLFVLITLIYLIWRNRQNGLAILIIFCFYQGLAAFHGKIIQNPYKILIVIISVHLLIKYKAISNLNKKEKIFILVFTIFSSYFLFSSILNKDSFNLCFSQYSKYFTSFCLYFLLNHFIKKSPEDIHYYKNVFFSLLNAQILLSFIKWYIFGIQEWIVGSILYEGGGPASILPVLGFILIWLNKQGELKTKDWIYVILLLIIGLASLKRAIWFIMPLFVFLFLYYVPKKVNIKKIIYLAPLIPLIFYLGVRLNPTLNKEHIMGGSFDLKYLSDYVMYYNFGKTEDTKTIQLGKGRGGATLLIWDKLLQNKSLSFNDFFGYGLAKYYASNYEQFQKYDFGLNHKGAATGVVQTYISFGFIGIIITILLIISILKLIYHQRTSITIGIFLFYDYLFYSGFLIRIEALAVLLYFIIIYSNLQSTRGNYIAQG